MNTDKLEIQRLVKVCEAKGISHAVICPGSRNAPLTIAFNRSSINCTVIADERVAGFFALGIAQQTGVPTVLICTSGSASLNFAPAIVEAYYQGIPLLVLTADRPVDMIDQGHGQTIRQTNLYANYIKGSMDLMEGVAEDGDFSELDTVVAKAIDYTVNEKYGPVHINIPLREPLYGLTAHEVNAPEFEEEWLGIDFDFEEYYQRIQSYDKVMILVGQNVFEDWSEDLKHLLASQHIVVLSEVTSNIEGDGVIYCIDRVLSSLSEEEELAFAPDLLISIGGAVVSKKIKAFLAKYKPKEHWNVGDLVGMADTYDALTEVLQCEESHFIEMFTEYGSYDASTTYFELWNERDKQIKVQTNQFLAEQSWHDFTVFNEIFCHIPEGTDVHYGNSTVVRYANLFEIGLKYRNYCNRGTSGIDGVTSTAMGSAYISKITTTVITGDIAFLYDSNALWHKYLKDLDIKIILINNGGGGIFRIIPGPDQLDELETYFDCYSEVDIQKLVEAFGLNYRFAEDLDSLNSNLKELYASEGPQFLEIKTNGALSAKVLREYLSSVHK